MVQKVPDGPACLQCLTIFVCFIAAFFSGTPCKLFSSAKFYKLFFPNHIDVLNIIFQSSDIVLLQVLGFRWYALNDKQFKLTSVNLNFQYYYEVFLKQRAQISPAIAHS